MIDHNRTSKALSYWLRHAPEDGGLILDDAGWAAVDGVLLALEREGLPHTGEHLASVVAGSEKNRFELSDAADRIRARQGHSIPVNAGWVVTSPPEWLYHGTVERFLASIMAEGLRPRSRHHVHLSLDVETARIVGARRGEPVILQVSAASLAGSGTEFLLSSNGVWLVDHVPPSALRRV